MGFAFGKTNEAMMVTTRGMFRYSAGPLARARRGLGGGCQAGAGGGASGTGGSGGGSPGGCGCLVPGAQSSPVALLLGVLALVRLCVIGRRLRG
jgi:hypothetical protein